MGIGLIVEAYFRFIHLNDFMGYAKVLGVLLGFVETVIGSLFRHMAKSGQMDADCDAVVFHCNFADSSCA